MVTTATKWAVLHEPAPWLPAGSAPQWVSLLAIFHPIHLIEPYQLTQPCVFQTYTRPPSQPTLHTTTDSSPQLGAQALHDARAATAAPTLPQRTAAPPFWLSENLSSLRRGQTWQDLQHIFNQISTFNLSTNMSAVPIPSKYQSRWYRLWSKPSILLKNRASLTLAAWLQPQMGLAAPKAGVSPVIRRNETWEGTSGWAPGAAGDRLESLLQINQGKWPSLKEQSVTRSLSHTDLLWQIALWIPSTPHTPKSHAAASLEAGSLHK